MRWSGGMRRPAAGEWWCVHTLAEPSVINGQSAPE